MYRRRVMFYDYVNLQRFPLTILIFSPLFSLKTSGYAYQETSKAITCGSKPWVAKGYPFLPKFRSSQNLEEIVHREGA